MSETSYPKWLVVLVLVLVVGLGVVGYRQFFGGTSTITVSGNGKTIVKQAKVSLIVSRVSVATDVTAAIDDNEASMARLLTLARQLGGANAEISKSVYQITPQSGQFLVANALSMKTTNVSNVDDIVKQFYKGGATSVTNISFLPADETAAEQAARKDAVSNAYTAAVDIAKSVGKHVGKVVSISDDQAGAASTISNATVGDNSQITVSKTVSVAYEIW